MTLKDFQIENKNKLDAEFIAKYPDGRITLERRKDGAFTISLGFKRNTSHTSSYRYGIAAKNSNLYPFSGLGFGKHNHYDNINDAIIAAQKFNFPDKLIKAFKLRYKGKDSKKFDYNNLQEIKVGSKVKLKNSEKNFHRDLDPETIYEVELVNNITSDNGYISTILTLKGLAKNYSTKEESNGWCSRHYYANDFNNVDYEVNLLNPLTNP